MIGSSVRNLSYIVSFSSSALATAPGNIIKGRLSPGRRVREKVTGRKDKDMTDCETPRKKQKREKREKEREKDRDRDRESMTSLTASRSEGFGPGAVPAGVSTTALATATTVAGQEEATGNTRDAFEEKSSALHRKLPFTKGTLTNEDGLRPHFPPLQKKKDVVFIPSHLHDLFALSL